MLNCFFYAVAPELAGAVAVWPKYRPDACFYMVFDKHQSEII